MTADNSTNLAISQEAASTNGNTPRTKICVFCGASAGTNPAYLEAARALGRAMAERNIDLGTIP